MSWAYPFWLISDLKPQWTQTAAYSPDAYSLYKVALLSLKHKSEEEYKSCI
jgi:hypothetical protein